MSRKVVIFDTSVLCCLLKVPGKDTCGPKHDAWDFKRINKKIDDEKKESSTFILPLAAIIETGNHITQIAGDSYRYVLAQLLAELIKKTEAGTEPWAVFSQQSHLWDNKNLLKLADTWPELAAHQKLSIGDATIKAVADYYSDSGCKVEILTGDQGLKRHEPAVPPPVPRRRKR